ncbi:peptidase S1 and S6 chymotrypsin/Hap [Chondrocystis sp. NIES-4102]|nr:peptidase S1 and S6 chymotrypsin/Hap [Chondrocystis sp. NIES-4102]
MLDRKHLPKKLTRLLGKKFLNLLMINLAISGVFWYKLSLKSTVAQNEVTKYVLPDERDDSEIYHLTQSQTIRVVKADSAGSGVIISKQDNIYTVLTSWHVINQDNLSIILTADDQQHQLLNEPRQIGQLDLAVVQFESTIEYPIAKIRTDAPKVGEKVYAAGFPLKIGQIKNTVNLGNQAFRLTQGVISLMPTKSLPEGYSLAYTNQTEPGMSGSPIFDERGQLIGIHGRGKYRDPGFGVYIFEDGSEPQPAQLKVMVQSSWGIPITSYLEVSQSQK